MKKNSAGIGVAVLLIMLGLLPVSKASEWTLILAPVRYSVLQVCFDLNLKRPVVLVSYQSVFKTGDLRLHVWNGAEWLPISRHDLAEVRFLEVVPGKVVAIGDAETLPSDLLQAVAWCPQIVAIEKMDTASLIEAFGRVFRFSAEDWAWFAARYRLKVEDRSRSQPAWFAQPGVRYEPRRLPLFRRQRPMEGGRVIPLKEGAIAPAVRGDDRTISELERVPPPTAEATADPVISPAAPEGPTAEKTTSPTLLRAVPTEKTEVTEMGGRSPSAADPVLPGIK